MSNPLIKRPVQLFGKPDAAPSPVTFDDGRGVARATPIATDTTADDESVDSAAWANDEATTPGVPADLTQDASDDASATDVTPDASSDAGAPVGNLVQSDAASTSTTAPKRGKAAGD